MSLILRNINLPTLKKRFRKLVAFSLQRKWFQNRFRKESETF